MSSSSAGSSVVREAILKGHKEAISAIEFEERSLGRRILTGCDDGTARLWDKRTQTSSSSSSSSQQTFALDWRSVRQLSKYNRQSEVDVEKMPINRVAFSATDENIILLSCGSEVVSFDLRNPNALLSSDDILHRFSVNTPQPPKKKEEGPDEEDEEEDEINDFVQTGDGTKLVVSQDSGKISVFDATLSSSEGSQETPNQQHNPTETFQAHGSICAALCATRRGGLFSGGYDNDVSFWRFGADQKVSKAPLEKWSLNEWIASESQKYSVEDWGQGVNPPFVHCLSINKRTRSDRLAIAMGNGSIGLLGIDPSAPPKTDAWIGIALNIRAHSFSAVTQIDFLSNQEGRDLIVSAGLDQQISLWAVEEKSDPPPLVAVEEKKAPVKEPLRKGQRAVKAAPKKKVQKQKTEKQKLQEKEARKNRTTSDLTRRLTFHLPAKPNALRSSPEAGLIAVSDTESNTASIFRLH